MKGFARIFEAIIASIIIIASVTYFFSPQRSESGWDSASLQLISQDTLQTAYLNGTIQRFVKTGDKQSLNTEIGNMLPRTADFSLHVNGLPNDIIRIACVDCAPVDMNELSNIINETDFHYHERPIIIRIETIDMLSEQIKEDTNILFFFDKSKIITYRGDTEDYLDSGGNVFLLDDVDQTDVSGYVGSLFNLTWTGTTAQSAVFYGTVQGGNVSHYVAKYYANLTEKNIGEMAAESFSAFNPTGVTATIDTKNIAVSSDFTRAYARSSQFNRTRSRLVWFGDYDRSDHANGNTKAIDRLLKAALMWGSGESYSLDVAKKSAAPVHFTSQITVFDDDVYIIELTLWRAFF